MLYDAIDVEVAEQYPSGRYVTACLAQLDVTSGRLRWISAGHPPPLLLRSGRFVKGLGVTPSPPMGLGWPMVRRPWARSPWSRGT